MLGEEKLGEKKAIDIELLGFSGKIQEEEEQLVQLK